MNPHGPEILAVLLATGTLLPGLPVDADNVDADELDQGVLQDEAFLLASVIWT